MWKKESCTNRDRRASDEECACTGPMGPRGYKGDPGEPGAAGAAGPAGPSGSGGVGSILSTFAVDGGVASIPADNAEHTVLDLPFTVTASGGTVDIFMHYSYINGGTSPVNGTFHIRVIAPDASDTVVGSSHTSASAPLAILSSDSGSAHRRLTGLPPGAYTARMTGIFGASAGTVLFGGGPAPDSPSNPYASLYVQEIRTVA